MNEHRDDFGYSQFKEIGKLSAMLPSYIRHCCRSLYDGTDNAVLDSNREIAYKVLLKYQDKYPFIADHLELLRIYSPEDVKQIITEFPLRLLDKNEEHIYKTVGCMAISTGNGLPKRQCLHCPKVGLILKRMKMAGTVNEEGERIGKH